MGGKVGGQVCRWAGVQVGKAMQVFDKSVPRGLQLMGVSQLSGRPRLFVWPPRGCV